MSFCDWPAWARYLIDWTVICLAWFAYRRTRQVHRLLLVNKSLCDVLQKVRDREIQRGRERA